MIAINGSCFHPKCLRCSECGIFLNENNLNIKDKKLFCKKHSPEKSTCYKCNNNIRGKFIECLERKYHSDCFENKSCNENEFFDYKDLKDNSKLPNWIDKRKKEKYLSEKDFEKVFGMTKKSFGKLTEWQQKVVKKKLFL
ncbi:regulation of actin filament depolymerization, variant 3 [Bonamia ostreae]|uniref:Regulation of actin filament depolymerization, variant 3 n=1 Tax=Bonamia ostreae TaxID=126728 RepID=A0ABV2AJH5_9EUKA